MNSSNAFPRSAFAVVGGDSHEGGYCSSVHCSQFRQPGDEHRREGWADSADGFKGGSAGFEFRGCCQGADGAFGFPYGVPELLDVAFDPSANFAFLDPGEPISVLIALLAEVLTVFDEFSEAEVVRAAGLVGRGLEVLGVALDHLAVDWVGFRQFSCASGVLSDSYGVDDADSSAGFVGGMDEGFFVAAAGFKDEVAVSDLAEELLVALTGVRDLGEVAAVVDILCFFADVDSDVVHCGSSTVLGL